MPAKIKLQNCEIMRADTRTTGAGKTMWNLLVKTWDRRGGTKEKPEFGETVLQVTVFNPTGRLPKSGDKYDIEGTFKTSSNPNYVQVRKDKLPNPAEADLKPSVFPEVTAFEDGLSLLSEADPTASRGNSGGRSRASSAARRPAATAAASRSPQPAPAEADDDPWAIVGG